MEGSSIIDLEFRHAVLNDPASANATARFFFRRQRRSLDDGSADNEETQQLDELKDRVRGVGLSIEEFRDPASLGEMVYDELIEIIKRDFADATPPTPLEEERSKHEAFAASRRRAYIPNPGYLKRLNEWLEGLGLRDEGLGKEQKEQVSSLTSNPQSLNPALIIYAESGSGKSSLVSFWCEQLRRRHPELAIIEHYVGIGAGDSDHLGIIRHIIAEIKEQFDRSEEIPSKPEDLEREFANWLGFVRTEDRGKRTEETETDRFRPPSSALPPSILLVIDGINQLSGRALDLHWLPPVMPPGVKLIITTTVEHTLVDLRKRDWVELGMQPLKQRERESVVVRFLAEYHKALSAEQVKLIAEDVKCSHPLFLRTLLEELRLYGTHEHLERTLRMLLSTTGTEDLFQRVLERLEDDYSQRVVREVMSLLWCSRSGLSETELGALTDISRLKLSTLLLGLDYHLVRRDGLLTFFHDYLRRAVVKRCLGDSQRQRQVHEQLAGYFEQVPVTLRSTRELLHALESLGQRERLEGALTNIERFKQLQVSDEFEVLRLWSNTEPSAVAAAYRTGLEHWLATSAREERGAVVRIVIDVFRTVGAWSEAQALASERLLLARERGDRLEEAEMSDRLGLILMDQGNHDDAFAEFQRALDLYAELGDRRNIAGTTNDIGILYLERQEYDKALKCFRVWEAYCREVGDRGNVAGVLHNIGYAYHGKQMNGEALEQFQQALDINRSIGNRPWMATNLGLMGMVYASTGLYEQALEFHRQQEVILRSIGHRHGLAGLLHNVGNVYADQGRYREAKTQFEQALEINRRIGNHMWAAFNLDALGEMYTRFGESEHALECYRQAKVISGEIRDRRTLAKASGDMGAVLVELAEAGGAMPEYLPKFVSGVSVGTWRAMSLQYARTCAEECIAISDEITRPDMRFDGRVLLAKIEAAEGRRDVARERLSNILEDAIDDAQQAELHYRLWKLGASNHAALALAIYETLYAATPIHDYHTRIQELKAEGQGL